MRYDRLQQKIQIENLKKKIEDLKSRLPAHSVKPHMLQELERLEELTDNGKRLLEERDNEGNLL